MSKNSPNAPAMVRCIPATGDSTQRFTTRHPFNNDEQQKIPTGFIARETAIAMCDDGAAKWLNRSTIQLKPKDDMPQTNDESCKMGSNVTECNASGMTWAKILVREWIPKPVTVVVDESGFQVAS